MDCICKIFHPPFAQPTRRILSSVSIGTIPSVRCTSFERDLSLVWAHCPKSSLSLPRSRCANLFWHTFNGKNPFFVKLPFGDAKAHKPERISPCIVALNTLHFLSWRSLTQSRNRPTFATHSKAAAIRVSLFLANDMFQVSLLPKYLTVNFELPSRGVPDMSLDQDLLAQMLLQLLWPR